MGILLVFFVFGVSKKEKPYLHYLNFMFFPLIIWTTISLYFSISILSHYPRINTKYLNERMFEGYYVLQCAHIGVVLNVLIMSYFCYPKIFKTCSTSSLLDFLSLISRLLLQTIVVEHASMSIQLVSITTSYQ